MTLRGSIVSKSGSATFENGVWLPISFDTESYDSDSYFDAGSPTIFTVPEDGYYHYLVNFRHESVEGLFWALSIDGEREEYSKEYIGYYSFPVIYDDQVAGGTTVGLCIEWMGWLAEGETIGASVGFFGTHADITTTLNARASICKVDGSITKTICKMRRSTDLEIAHDTETVVEWDTEDLDTNSMWSSGNPTRITVPASGYYQIFGQAKIDNSDGQYAYCYQIGIKKNGTLLDKTAFKANYIWVAIEVYLAVSDYIEMTLYQKQSSGSGSCDAVAAYDKPQLVVRRIDE